MALSSHDALVRLKNYISTNYSASLASEGLDAIGNYRVGQPIDEGFDRALGVYVHPGMGIEFNTEDVVRTDCELAVGLFPIVVGLLLDPTDDNGGVTGEDSKLYKYMDLLVEVLGEYTPIRAGSLRGASPQHAVDTGRPDVYLMFELEVAYDET